MSNFLKPVKKYQEKQISSDIGESKALNGEAGSSIEQPGENVLFRFMRGLITIQIDRLTPSSFWFTLLFMVFVIVMMKFCSEILVAFLQTFSKIPSLLK